MNAATPNTTQATNQAKDEMEFRLSLLTLMTVPQDGAMGVSPAAHRQIEELSVLVPVNRKSDQRA